ncbi:MAG: SRPBCC family protein [Mycobacterium sp.]
MSWRRSAEFTLREEVAAPPDRVRDFYVDLDNMRLVHPLVVCVRTVARDDTSTGYVRTYRVVDRIPLGRVTLRTRYLARVHVPFAGDVTAEARQFAGVRVRSVVAFDEIDSGTRIVEQMRIAVPWPLAGVTISQAVQAHSEMLSNIRRYFA